MALQTKKKEKKSVKNKNDQTKTLFTSSIKESLKIFFSKKRI